MLFECKKLCPSSYYSFSHSSFWVLVQVEDKLRAKRGSIMNESLIELIITLLPQEDTSTDH